MNSKGDSQWSDELEIASVTSLYPKTPSGILLTLIEARTFTVEWNGPDANDAVVRYELYVADAGIGQHATVTVASEGTCAVDVTSKCSVALTASMFPTGTVGMEPNSTYYLEIRAVNVHGPSVASDLLSVHTLAAVPDLPIQPAVSHVNRTSISMRWTKPPNNGAPITGYRLWACVLQEELCNSQHAAPVCAGPNEFCFHDGDCEAASLDPYGGLGCGAGGFATCRFCGFGQYANIPCPTGNDTYPTYGGDERICYDDFADARVTEASIMGSRVGRTSPYGLRHSTRWVARAMQPSGA